MAVALSVTWRMQGFRHIRAWQRGMALSVVLHKATSGFSRAGHSNLRSQLTRAADAISSNIAEGCGASTDRDFARFLDVSIKSAMETENHLIKAYKHHLLTTREFNRLLGELVEIRKMTWGYRRRVLGGEEDEGRPKDKGKQKGKAKRKRADKRENKRDEQDRGAEGGGAAADD